MNPMFVVTGFTVEMDGLLEVGLPIHGTLASIDFAHGTPESGDQLATILTLSKEAERGLRSFGDIWVQPVGSSESRMKIVLDVIASPEDDRSNVPEIKTSVIEGNAPRRGGGAAVSIYLWRYPPPGLDWGRAWTPSRRASGESDSLFNTPEWGDDARIMLVAQETSALDFFVTDSMTMIGQASGSLVLTGELDKEIPLGFSPQDFVFEFRRVAFSASSDEQSKSVDWSGEVTKDREPKRGTGLGVSKGVGRMARLPPVVSLGINRSPVVRYSEVAPEI